jgi:hypothetical protein
MSRDLTSGFFIPAHIAYTKSKILSWSAKVLFGRLRVMFEATDRYTGKPIEVHPSNAWIADELELSERQAARIVAELIKAGAVTAEYQRRIDPEKGYYTVRILHEVTAENYLKNHPDNIRVRGEKKCMTKMSSSIEKGVHDKNVRTPRQKCPNPTTKMARIDTESGTESGTDTLGAREKNSDENTGREDKPTGNTLPPAGGTKQNARMRKPPLSEREPENDNERVEKRWAENYTELFGHAPLKPNYGKTRALLKDLLKQLPVDELLTVLDSGKSDPWIVEKGYGLSILLSAECINRLRDGGRVRPAQRQSPGSAAGGTGNRITRLKKTGGLGLIRGSEIYDEDGNEIN